MPKLTLEEIKQNEEVKAYIQKADEQMKAMGYTEHSFRHAELVANIARNIFVRLGRDEREAELAGIAGYLHDIGNVVNRQNHPEVSAIIALEILRKLGMAPEEIAEIVGAIGNHEEDRGEPISAIAAALILADKSDVHRSRVRNPNMIRFDIHDRVNYAAKQSFLRVNGETKTIALELTIDTKISAVMEYFEIFLSRMMISRKAAEFLGCQFKLVINGISLL